MTDVLVTGGAGFIGSHLVRRLAEVGGRVRVLDDLSTGFASNLDDVRDRVELMEGDLTNPEDCARAAAGVEVVFHHGALPSVPVSVKDPVKSHHVNVTGTLNMLIAARDAGVRRFVYAGSSSAYGDQDNELKHEELAPRPLSPYAAAKLAGEHYVQAFAESFGLGGVVLRYFNVFGPRQNPDSPYSAVIPLFIRAALRGERPVIYGDGTQSRDFTYVENNVEANILAAKAESLSPGRVYNVACGTSYSLLELLEVVNEVLGTSVEPIFEARRPGDVLHSKADISRARSELGYEPGVSFKHGLEKTINWYRENSS